jgi:hypothetical protein
MKKRTRATIQSRIMITAMPINTVAALNNINLKKVVQYYLE